MTKPNIVVFCMPEEGHFRQLRPIVSGLAASGFPVHVLTHRRFAADIESDGAIPVDLFEAHPLEAVADNSFPAPSRYVTYAAMYAESVVALLKDIRPNLVVYETFAVIGYVAAHALGVPFVN